MIKPVVSEIDQKIMKYLGWKTPIPFSTSDTYIGIVKRYLEKQGISWNLSYDKTGKKYAFIIKAENTYDGVAESENLAVCLSFEKYMKANPKP